MEVTCSSAPSVEFQRTTQRCIAELIILNVNNLEHVGITFLSFRARALFVTSRHNFRYRCVVHSSCSQSGKHVRYES
jgi:hypothetical protein